MDMEIMKEEEAEGLADLFSEWVSPLLNESAKGARQVIRWFIKTLYAQGYEISKKIKGD